MHSLSSAPLAICLGLKIGREATFPGRVVGRGCSMFSTRASAAEWEPKIWSQSCKTIKHLLCSALLIITPSFFPHCLWNLRAVFFGAAGSLLVVIFLSWFFFLLSCLEEAPQLMSFSCTNLHTFPPSKPPWSEEFEFISWDFSIPGNKLWKPSRSWCYRTQ